MFEWLGALGKNFGAHKAVDFAVNWLQSDSGKKVAEQQVTGFLGLSKVDESIMAHLMSTLQQFYPKEYVAVRDFLAALKDSERARVREILGMIQVLPPVTQRIPTPVLGADGKQITEGGKPKFTESVFAPTVEFTREDPRIIILVQLGRCIQSAGSAAQGIEIGKRMLVVTGMLLDKTVLERIGGALSMSKERFMAGVYSAFGAQDYTHLVQIIETRTQQWERDLEHKQRLGLWGWFPTDKPATMIVYTLIIAAIIYMAVTLATLPPL